MSDAGGWPMHEPVCRRVFDCLWRVYERDEVEIFAAGIGPELRETLDGVRRRQEMWLRLLDAATRSGLVAELMRAVLADRRRVACHDRVTAWLAWQEERQVRRRRLTVVPDLTDVPEFDRAELAAQVDILDGLVSGLGPAPTPGLVRLYRHDLRECLDRIAGLLDAWRESVLAEQGPVDERADLLARITRRADARRDAATALADLSARAPSLPPPADPMSRLVQAVGVLTDLS